MSETHLILLVPVVVILFVILLCIYLAHVPLPNDKHTSANTESTTLLPTTIKVCITLTHVIKELSSVIQQMNQSDIDTKQISQTTNHIKTELDNLLQTLTITKDPVE